MPVPRSENSAADGGLGAHGNRKGDAPSCPISGLEFGFLYPTEQCFRTPIERAASSIALREQSRNGFLFLAPEFGAVAGI